MSVSRIENNTAPKTFFCRLTSFGSSVTKRTTNKYRISKLNSFRTLFQYDYKIHLIRRKKYLYLFCLMSCTINIWLENLSEIINSGGLIVEKK